ncbi:uncharacterized protein PV09_08542 [Verruconis gallopava]|uniref:Ubiquinol-cytochrome-c reductase complex assembly factor 2 n=1 Tax=Verruconis gallopava TaxID=253628 RepID=A0A0D1XC75_9PEZI|nr:uncharacterized protein PV09_08542 [Verruconis gallopava]KIV99875.1 hypothetical protein PV09_08542 [Verruconis gallopava]
MSRTLLTKHYQRIASLWPKDPMRPDRVFSKVLEHREKHLADAGQAELRNINALYSLLDDRYSKKYPTPKHVLSPQSNPNHYIDLIAELEKAPTRSWWDNFVTNLKGRIRFS